MMRFCRIGLKSEAKIGWRQPVKKPKELLRVATFNPYLPAAAVSLCVLPPGSPKGEKQSVIIPSKNKFFDCLAPAENRLALR